MNLHAAAAVQVRMARNSSKSPALSSLDSGPLDSGFRHSPSRGPIRAPDSDSDSGIWIPTATHVTAYAGMTRARLLNLSRGASLSLFCTSDRPRLWYLCTREITRFSAIVSPYVV